MAKDKLTEYSATNASNDVIGDISVSEGMLPSAVNNALREQMTHLKNFADGTDAINALAVDNLKLDGNTISSTDTNGNITIDPDGTGDTIVASGNVGIGTSSPATQLHVQNSSGNSTSILGQYGTGTRAEITAASNQVELRAYNGTNDVMTFKTGSSERLRIDSSGNVGISNTTPSSFFAGARNLVVGSGSGNQGMTIYSGTSNIGNIKFADGTGSDAAKTAGGIRYDHSGGFMRFDTNDGSERLRIDSSGSVGIGTSSVTPGFLLEGVGDARFGDVSGDDALEIGWSGGGGYAFVQAFDRAATAQRDLLLNSSLRITSAGNVGINTSSPSFPLVVSGTASNHVSAFQTATNGYAGVLWFNASGSIVGQVVINASSTAYITSSDYRLKTAVNYDWDATTRLKQLKPARFEWISDGEDAVPVDGFLAHEVQDVVPEAITGTHNEVDDDGNPVYQGIDQSKLVPLLVKTIQELEARITALEAN